MAFLFGCQARFWVERSRKKNCTQANWQEAPPLPLAACCLPGRAREQHRPLGSLRIISAASCPQRNCQVPATGARWPPTRSPCHPLCLSAQPLKTGPSNSPCFSGLRQTDTQGFLSLPHAPPPAASESHAGYSGSSACSLPVGHLPKGPLLVWRVGEPSDAASTMGGLCFVQSSITTGTQWVHEKSFFHTHCALHYLVFVPMLLLGKGLFPSPLSPTRKDLGTLLPLIQVPHAWNPDHRRTGLSYPPPAIYASIQRIVLCLCWVPVPMLNRGVSTKDK